MLIQLTEILAAYGEIPSRAGFSPFSMMAIALFVGTLLLSLAASARVKSQYAKYSQLPLSSAVTGAEAAAHILQAAGIHDVEILQHDEMLGDHYDPMNKRLVLSTDNYHGISAAAVGVAAHECGHAIQHKIAYGPLHLRMAAVRTTNIASAGVMVLPFLGFILGMLPIAMLLLAACWGVVMLFNLVTLPVEFDASRRAKLILAQMGMVREGEEADGVRRVLDAAAWTYVAAFVTSLLYFLWHLLPFLLGGRRDE